LVDRLQVGPLCLHGSTDVPRIALESINYFLSEGRPLFQSLSELKCLPYRSCHSSCKKAKSSPIYPGSHHGKEPWIDTLCCLKVQGNCHCLSVNRDKGLYLQSNLSLQESALASWQVLAFI
jgi:hypothetical protein